MRDGWHEVSKGFWQKQFGTHIVGWAWTSGRWQAGLMGRNFASGKSGTPEDAQQAADEWVAAQNWPAGATTVPVLTDGWGYRYVRCGGEDVCVDCGSLRRREHKQECPVLNRFLLRSPRAERNLESEADRG